MAFVDEPRDGRAERRAPRQARRRPTCCRSRSTGGPDCRRACRASSATWWSARHVAAARRDADRRCCSCTARCTWSARPRDGRRRDAGPPGRSCWRRWRRVAAALRSRDEAVARGAAGWARSGRRATRRPAWSPASTTPSRASSTWSARSGTCACTSRSRWAAAGRRGAGRDQVRAAGADARGLLRADRRDDQHGAGEGDRRRHQLVRPAGPGGQGRRRRRRAGGRRERPVRRLPGVRRPPPRPQPPRDRHGARLAGAPDRDRARRRDRCS